MLQSGRQGSRGGGGGRKPVCTRVWSLPGLLYILFLKHRLSLSTEPIRSATRAGLSSKDLPVSASLVLRLRHSSFTRVLQGSYSGSLCFTDRAISPVFIYLIAYKHNGSDLVQPGHWKVLKNVRLRGAWVSASWALIQILASPSPIMISYVLPGFLSRQWEDAQDSRPTWSNFHFLLVVMGRCSEEGGDTSP